MGNDREAAWQEWLQHAEQLRKAGIANDRLIEEAKAKLDDAWTR